MKIVFTLGSPKIGGGTNVIFEHAGRLAELGEEVYIVNDKKVKYKDCAWHSKAHLLKFITYKDCKNLKFDIAIATWWQTVYKLYNINANKYIYFVQSIESKFYKNNELSLKTFAELTYCFGLPVITEATWIKKYLEKNYGTRVELVRNGIRKDIYKILETEECKHKGLRILVEGPVDVDFKNVPKTIKLVKKSRADEIWLLTSSNIKKYPGVDKVFSNIKPAECAKIYSACDAIVKLSYVEGMFGPPLEMFHCGGTCVVYKVTGADEYIINEFNGYIVKKDDEDQVIKCINKLKDIETLNRLKKNAIKTAEKWDSWEASSNKFYKSIKRLNECKTPTQDDLRKSTKMFLSIHEFIVNESPNNYSLKTKIGNYFRKNMKPLYKIYYKIVTKNDFE